MTGTAHPDVDRLRLTVEAELRETEERYRQLTEAAVEGILIHENGVALDANPQFARMFGYELEELIGRNVLDFLAAPQSRGMIVDKMRAHSEERYEVTGIRKDGSRIVLEITGRDTSYRGRRVRVATVHDITDRKRADEAARQLIEAEATTRARDEVLSVVAHDLRTPIHTIAMAAAMLCDLDSDRREYTRKSAEAIRRAAAQMSRLVQDLLDFKRAEAGLLRVQARPEPPARLVLEVAELLRPLAVANGLELTAEVPDGLPMVFADRDRVEQVLSNLVANAIKFTPPGGRVVVQARPDGGRRVMVAVADTGPGIPREQLPHVFARFWQGGRADRRGLGLGLPIAKGIVEAHGGRIWVESKPGAGSTFYFTLPAAQAGGTD
jgi:PAS domain S-box-containing protein